MYSRWKKCDKGSGKYLKKRKGLENTKNDLKGKMVKDLFTFPSLKIMFKIKR